MDYKKSPTKCSLSVKDACLYSIAAFPYQSWSSTGTVWHAYFIIAALIDGSIFHFSRECLHVTITHTFIHALVTPTYTKESHNLCTKDTVCTFHL